MLERGMLHADETPVVMLVPGKGKTHRAYVWTYGTTSYDRLKAVIYEFAESRAGEHARWFLEGWSGKLVCDDFAGYRALFRDAVTEVGCMAHANAKTDNGSDPLRLRKQHRASQTFEVFVAG